MAGSVKVVWLFLDHRIRRERSKARRRRSVEVFFVTDLRLIELFLEIIGFFGHDHWTMTSELRCWSNGLQFRSFANERCCLFAFNNLNGSVLPIPNWPLVHRSPWRQSSSLACFLPMFFEHSLVEYTRRRTCKRRHRIYCDLNERRLNEGTNGRERRRRRMTTSIRSRT